MMVTSDFTRILENLLMAVKYLVHMGSSAVTTYMTPVDDQTVSLVLVHIYKVGLSYGPLWV